ncbi:MAG TPA: lipocalin-like domain-containing protein [Steroidobacteraceae bacterium]|nr:lipocalin-like domain-containing protein [Steroidobacteraceae bacterium]
MRAAGAWRVVPVLLLMLGGACERTGPGSGSGGAGPGRAGGAGGVPAAAGEDGGTDGMDRLAMLRLPAEPGFAEVTGPTPLRFPADFGPHPQYRYEWWYFTGRLRSAQGQFGFELTFFRFALAPPAAASASASAPASAPASALALASAPASASAPALGAGATPSRWRARELYAAHFAITDLPRRRFHSAVRVARAALGLSGATTQPLAVWVRDWSLSQAPAAPGATAGSPRTAQGLRGAGAGEPALPRWRLRAADADYALQLDLDAVAAPVLNGAAGFSRKADEPGAASEYYSIPRLQARGTLWRGGQPQTVAGEAWLDREWGSGALGAGQEGWDWFALQLDDGSTLMFYALRRRGGGYDRHSAGTWVDAQGRPQQLAAADVQIDVRAHWASPRGGRYPAAWQLRVPRLKLALAIRPVLADQEVQATPRYWEGAVDAAGTRQGLALTGSGYVELVGYADSEMPDR